MASQKQLEGTRVLRIGHTHAKVDPSTSEMVAREKQCASISTITPTKTCSQKEGWGTNLNEHTARGTWSLPESRLHINYLELKAVLLTLKEFQDPCENNIVVIATYNTTVVDNINKEGGGEVGPPVCPSVENSDLVLQETGDSQSTFQAG